MGDVALTLPVLKGFLNQNDKLIITFVTRPLYASFFESIQGLDLFLCDFEREYSGLRGLFRLFKKLTSRKKYDSIIDLHGVTRTRILNLFFRLSGIPVYSINKGRREKRRLIKGKIFKPLKSTLDRYLETFDHFNLKFKFPDNPVLAINKKYVNEANNFIRKNGISKNIMIGVAPFALHNLKTWPMSYMEQLIRLFENRLNAFVFLFGGTENEIIKLENLSRGFHERINVAGKLSLGAQLALMQKMNFMVTMDSANMHLAALGGVTTIAIWGATHPYAGFDAYRQINERNIQIDKDELSCRPCTVFGSGTCKRKDFACMQWLLPEIVFGKINALNLIEDHTDKK